MLCERESSICRLLHALSALAPRNMPVMSVTLPTSKNNGWSKEETPANMESMRLTLLVSSDSGWLNATAW